MKINFVVGDATAPIGNGHKFIVHCCNNQGGWGSGFVLALNRRWKHIQSAYEYWYYQSGPGKSEITKEKKWEKFQGCVDYPYGMTGKFELGQVQWVKAEKDVWVYNLIGQHRTGLREIAGVTVPPVDYRSIREGFAHIKQYYFESIKQAGKNFSLHMPRMGCGLAGGKWTEIEKLLKEVFNDIDITITVYDYAPGAVSIDEDRDKAYHVFGWSDDGMWAKEGTHRLLVESEEDAPSLVVFKGGLFKRTTDEEYGCYEYELETDFTGDR